MMKFSKFLSFAIAFFLTLSLFTSAYADINDAARSAVYSYFDSLSNNQWTSVAQLIAEEDQNEFCSFIANADNAANHIGYYNYFSADLISCDLVTDPSYDLSYVDLEKRSTYSNWACWDCIVNVITYRDTAYLTSGNNRFIVYTACDSNGNYRVCEVLRIRDYVAPNDSITTFSYDAPVAAGSREEWEMPETIRVRRVAQETATGTVPIIDEVEFKEYCYIVTANEFGTSTFNEEARKAVALCVKQYGWNRTLVQKYSAYEYDVKDNTYDQVYNPSTIPTEKVIAAVDAIWDYVMLSCDLKLFCSFYVASNSINSFAVYHGGMLSQYEANSLGKQGYTWDSILHYFYDYGEYNQEMTEGVISIVNLNHAPTGSFISYPGDYSYHRCVCTVCGCTHRVPHTWVYVVDTNVCTDCGMTSLYDPIAPFVSTNNAASCSFEREVCYE